MKTSIDYMHRNWIISASQRVELVVESNILFYTWRILDWLSKYLCLYHFCIFLFLLIFVNSFFYYCIDSVEYVIIQYIEFENPFHIYESLYVKNDSQSEKFCTYVRYRSYFTSQRVHIANNDDYIYYLTFRNSLVTNHCLHYIH